MRPSSLLPYDEGERRVWLLTDRAMALLAAGRLEESRALVGELIAATPIEQRTALVTLSVEADMLLGQHERATRELESLLDHVGPDERALIHIQLTSTALFAGDGETARGMGLEGLERLRETGPPSYLASAKALHSYARLLRRRAGRHLSSTRPRSRWPRSPTPTWSG